MKKTGNSLNIADDTQKKRIVWSYG